MTMKGRTIASVIELRNEPSGLSMGVLFPGDATRVFYPLASHTLSSGRPLMVGDLVELDGDREWATKAWIDGTLVSARDWRYAKRKWRPVKPGRN